MPNDHRGGRTLAAVLAAALLALALATNAAGHAERPSYWPDPAADSSVSPPAGGEVPKARSLASAVSGRGPGVVRVVCEGRRSLELARRSIRTARRDGFRLRPSQPRRRLSSERARRLLAINRALLRECEYSSVQAAVLESGNNDRIVIMPGRYTEPRSRRQPESDPRCAEMVQPLRQGNTVAPTYESHVVCPNDQSLIHVAGRAVKGEPTIPASDDLQGIPESELGRCIRCNLQLEGSGAKPTDVILDAGKNYASNRATAKPGGPDTYCPEEPEACYAKDVVIRIDRADGFLGRNFTTRAGHEFGLYAEETDGLLLDRVKFFWGADYGQLSFTTDHHVIKNCDGFGSGDAIIYPGGAPETGAQGDKSFYPDAPRFGTVIRRCDMRGANTGLSGSMGNAVRITENHIYNNTTGISIDTVSVAGHPGFPADSTQIDHNLIYSNNMNMYSENAAVPASEPRPLGVGIMYAGHNSGRVFDNWIFDNWRNGAMLFSVPEGVTGATPEGTVNEGIACPAAPENGVSTSCGNRFFGNRMGQAPPGFKFPPAIDQFGVNPHGSAAGPLPNGTDFWWDEFLGNTGNCWYENTGVDGAAASVTGPGSPSMPPDILPSDCATSVGPGDLARVNYMVDCAEGFDMTTCDWLRAPPKPGSEAAERERRRRARASAAFESSAEAASLRERLAELLG